VLIILFVGERKRAASKEKAERIGFKNGSQGKRSQKKVQRKN
jgi:hypothetical protein